MLFLLLLKKNLIFSYYFFLATDGDYYRDLQLVKMQRIIDYR